jgi:hypothetical protein
MELTYERPGFDLIIYNFEAIKLNLKDQNSRKSSQISILCSNQNHHHSTPTQLKALTPT